MYISRHLTEVIQAGSKYFPAILQTGPRVEGEMTE